MIYLCSWSSPNHTVKNASFHIHALKISDGTLIRPPESLQGVVYKPPGGLPEQRFNSAARKQRAALTLSQVKDGHGKFHKIGYVQNKVGKLLFLISNSNSKQNTFGWNYCL